MPSHHDQVRGQVKGALLNLRKGRADAYVDIGREPVEVP